MSNLCGCLGSNEEEPRTQVPANPEAGFMHRVDSQPNQPPQYDAVTHGYTPVVPLPRYTPRAMSIHEKSIDNNAHNQQLHHQTNNQDEKNRQDFEEQNAVLQSHSTGASSTSSGGATVTATMDDASSAYSFPSSFGQTSTATRDTPPPPYSACGSASLFSRSRASSLRSNHRRSDSLSIYQMPPLLISLQQQQQQQQFQQNGSDFTPATITPPPMAHVNSTQSSVFAPPLNYPPPFNSRQSNSRPVLHQNQRRLSWES